MSWRCLEDVLKTYSQDEYIGLDQDVLKTSSEDEDERRLQDVFIKTNVCWVVPPRISESSDILGIKDSNEFYRVRNMSKNIKINL